MRWKRSRRKTRFTKRVCLHRGPRRNVELICLDLTSKQTSVGQSWILKMAFGSSAPAVRVFPRPINACRVDLPSKVCACRRIGSSGRGCDSRGSSRSTLANHQYKVGTTFGLVFICSLLNLLVEPRARLLSASAFLSSICSLGRQRGREGGEEKPKLLLSDDPLWASSQRGHRRREHRFLSRSKRRHQQTPPPGRSAHT